MTPRWFYKGLLDQLGLESCFYRGDSKRQLQQEIEIIRGMQQKKVVCILDEAHLLKKALIYAFQNHKRLIDDYMIKYVVEHEMLGTMTTSISLPPELRRQPCKG